MEARRATLVFGTNALGGVTGLVILFFVGRFMSPAAYGAFGFAMAFLGLWMVLADLGLGQSHARAITRGADLGDCIATFRGLKLGIYVVFLAGMLVSFWLYLRTGTLRDSSSRFAIVGVLLYAAAFYLRTIDTGTLTALRLTAASQFTVLVEHLVRLPLTILVALFFGFMTDAVVPWPEAADWIAGHTPFHRPMTDDEGGFLLAAALAASLWVSYLVGRVLFLRQSFPKGHFDRDLARTYVAFAIPVALGASTRIIFTNLDAVFIGWFLDADNVGYYFAADRLTLLVLMVPVALQTVFFPVFGQLAHKNDTAVLAAMSRNLQRTISLIMVLLAVFFIVYPGRGIHIFMGDPFLPAQDPLRLLALNALFLSLALVPTMLIMMAGNPYTIVRTGLAALVANVILNLVLIPDTLLGYRMVGWHSAGAALGTALSQLLNLALLTWHARKLLGQHIIPRSVVKHAAAGILTGITLHLATPWMFGDAARIWELATAAVLGTAIYTGLLWLLREFSRQDLGILRDATNPKQMLADVKAELRDKRRT